MSKQTGGPAFPINVDSEMTCLGMTLRDYFAAAYLANKWAVANSHQFTAQTAYALADAMLKAREQ